MFINCIDSIYQYIYTFGTFVFFMWMQSKHCNKCIGGGRESGSDDSAGSLTLPEYVYAIYNELMKNGWHMKEIDEMDMLGFLRLRAWDAQREQEKKTRQRFIDEVWPGMKP